MIHMISRIKSKTNEKGYFLISLIILLPVLMFCTYLIIEINADRRLDLSIDRIIDRAAFAATTKVDLSKFPDTTELLVTDAKRYAVQLIYDNFNLPSDPYLENIDSVHDTMGVPQKIIPIKSLGADLEIMGIYIINSRTGYDTLGNPVTDQTYFEYHDPYFKTNKKLKNSAVAIVARLHYHNNIVQKKPYKYLHVVQELRPRDFL